MTRPKLTPTSLAVLVAAVKTGPVGLRRVHRPDRPGTPPWPAHPSTLAALVRHGLLERVQLRNRDDHPVEAWKATRAGVAHLEPVVVVLADRPRFMADRRRSASDYTSERGKAIDDLEVLDAPDHVVSRAEFGRRVAVEEASPAGRRRVA